MNAYSATSQEGLRTQAITDLFLLGDVELPERIQVDGVILAGFADECTARQSAEFFSLFLQFLGRVEETSFYFSWIDSAAPDQLTVSLHDIDDLADGQDFVRIQSSIPDEVFVGGRWFVASSSARWAVYGEHYGSELAVLLARDDAVARILRDTFSPMSEDARQASEQFGDPSVTEAGLAWAAILERNYPPFARAGHESGQ